MGASTAYLNSMVTGASGDGYAAPHTGNTGSTGANELAGDTRVAVTWAAASGGGKSNSAAYSLTIPAAATITGIGHWSAVTAGTFAIGVNFSSSITFSGAGTLSVAIGADTITLTDSQP
jgi:hypothetical protein